MAQTLTQVANTAITTDALAKTMAQAVAAQLSATANLSLRDVKAIAVLSMITSLQGAGGNDYRTNHPQLLADAARSLAGIPLMPEPMQRARLLAVGDVNNSGSVNTLLTNARDLAQLSDVELDRIIAFLRYQLNA